MQRDPESQENWEKLDSEKSCHHIYLRALPWSSSGEMRPREWGQAGSAPAARAAPARLMWSGRTEAMLGPRAPAQGRH